MIGLSISSGGLELCDGGEEWYCDFLLLGQVLYCVPQYLANIMMVMVMVMVWHIGSCGDR